MRRDGEADSEQDRIAGEAGEPAAVSRSTLRTCTTLAGQLDIDRDGAAAVVRHVRIAELLERVQRRGVVAEQDSGEVPHAVGARERGQPVLSSSRTGRTMIAVPSSSLTNWSTPFWRPIVVEVGRAPRR
jgi:hypothetical protein